MPTAPFAPVLSHVRALAGAAYDSLTDQQLLDHFTRGNDGAAFAVIVRRHGPMILGVCRRILHDRHDADDAFQATFLVLVRRARKLRQPELLGNWLFGVARRVASKAKARSDRRRGRERPVEENSAITPESPAEMRWLLDDAIARLPERYRTPLVLCCLEGLTQSQTAERLQCPPATVATRVARAKAQLRVRLSRMGLAPAAAALAADLTADTLTAAVPTTLARSTSAAAIAVATGTVAGVPVPILTLTEGVVRAMVMHSWKTAIVVGAAIGLAGAGAGMWSVAGEPPRTTAAPPVAGAPPAPVVEVPPAAAPAEETEKPSLCATTNFIVHGLSPRMTRLVADTAERWREQHALQWLGKVLPPWEERCSIVVRIEPRGGGGATTIQFGDGKAKIVGMRLDGPYDRILGSTLPHEVTHAVLATAMGRPMPRWADEGAALLAEDLEDTQWLEQAVHQVLSRKVRVPLRRLFAVREYNEFDVHLLFAQAYSVVRFLAERADKPTFLTFVKKGMDEGWDAAAKSCYRFDNVELMEAAWLEWLRVRGIKPTNEARPAKGEDLAFPIRHTVPAPAPPNAPAAKVSVGPQIVTAWVDEDGKLAVRYQGVEFIPITSYRRDENGATVPVTSLAPAGQGGVRRYRLLDVRGFHLKKASLEEIELRTLAALLKHEVPVVVITASRPAEGPRSFEKLFFSVIKDDTIVLYLPSGDQLSPRPPAPPPLTAPATPPIQRH
jgi:RNA polymerase sigma factor (sigma-70 family)